MCRLKTLNNCCKDFEFMILAGLIISSVFSYRFIFALEILPYLSISMILFTDSNKNFAFGIKPLFIFSIFALSFYNYISPQPTTTHILYLYIFDFLYYFLYYFLNKQDKVLNHTISIYMLSTNRSFVYSFYTEWKNISNSIDSKF